MRSKLMTCLLLRRPRQIHVSNKIETLQGLSGHLIARVVRACLEIIPCLVFCSSQCMLGVQAFADCNSQIQVWYACS